MQSADNNSQSQPENISNDQPVDPNIVSESKKQTKKNMMEKMALMEHAQKQFTKFFQDYLNHALECHIGLEVMTDPVVVSTGYTFDRKNIADSIRVRGWKCPMTRKDLKQMDFIPNMAMRSLIDEYTKLTKRLNQVNGEELLKKRKKKNSNRLTIEEYQKIYTKLEINGHKRLLKHDFKKVVMEDFVRCKWNMIEEMDLSYCEIDDKGIEMLLEHGKSHFQNVRRLNLNANEIKNVRELERLPELRFLSIQNNKNLSVEAKAYFKGINETKGKLKISY